jgi:hypothetical protein
LFFAKRIPKIEGITGKPPAGNDVGSPTKRQAQEDIMPENKPESRPGETAPQAAEKSPGKPAREVPSPEEIRQFMAQANKSPDDFE